MKSGRPKAMVAPVVGKMAKPATVTMQKVAPIKPAATIAPIPSVAAKKAMGLAKKF